MGNLFLYIKLILIPLKPQRDNPNKRSLQAVSGEKLITFGQR